MKEKKFNREKKFNNNTNYANIFELYLKQLHRITVKKMCKKKLIETKPGKQKVFLLIAESIILLQLSPITIKYNEYQNKKKNKNN